MLTKGWAQLIIYKVDGCGRYQLQPCRYSKTSYTWTKHTTKMWWHRKKDWYHCVWVCQVIFSCNAIGKTQKRAKCMLVSKQKLSVYQIIHLLQISDRLGCLPAMEREGEYMLHKNKSNTIHTCFRYRSSTFHLLPRWKGKGTTRPKRATNWGRGIERKVYVLFTITVQKECYMPSMYTLIHQG